MKRLLKSKIALPLLGGLSYLITTCLLLFSSLSEPTVAPSHEEGKQTPSLPIIGETGASWNYTNPEITDLYAQMQETEAKLKRREEALQRWEDRLKSEALQIHQVTNQIYLLQKQLDETINRFPAEQEKNMEQIVTLYRKMPAEDAGKLLYEKTDLEIAKIFKLLKESEINPIIQLWANQGNAQLKRVGTILEEYKNLIQVESAPETLSPAETGNPADEPNLANTPDALPPVNLPVSTAPGDAQEPDPTTQQAQPQ